MPTPPRTALALVACAALLLGGAVVNADVSYGARQATCILVSPVADPSALAIPPLPDDAPAALVFPEPPPPPPGATSAVLWEDVYGEQHIAVDPDHDLRRRLDRDQRFQQARACGHS